MRFVAERVLPAYLRALEDALDTAIRRLPVGHLRTILTRLRRRLGHHRTPFRLGALERLAIIGEIEGWLEPEEAIIIRKLAYRVAFFVRRAEEARDERRAKRDENEESTHRPRDREIVGPWAPWTRSLLEKKP